MPKMPKRTRYKIVAERVLAAVRELNSALVEAHEHPQTRVHMLFPQHETNPAQFGCEVTRITKHRLPPEGDGIKEWQLAVKVAEKSDLGKKVDAAAKAGPLKGFKWVTKANKPSVKKAKKPSVKKAKKPRARKAA